MRSARRARTSHGSGEARFGLGTLIGKLFEPPLAPEHIAKYGESKPLPLSFGLTGSAIAQQIAGALLIMAFPFVASIVGWALGRVASALTHDP